MIGIICALKEEYDKINALMVDSGEIEADGLLFMRGEIGNQEVVTTKCGMGKVFAAMYAQAMIDEFLPDIVMSFGAAGSLSPDLHIGDVAIIEKVVQHDMDTSPIGFRKGEIAELSTIWFECHKDVTELLCSCAQELGISYKRASAATGDKFINSPDAKAEILKNFDAHITEMEGGAIAQVCAVHNVPFEIVRVITDEADCSAPDNFSAFLTKVTDDAGKLVELFCTKFV